MLNIKEYTDVSCSGMDCEHNSLPDFSHLPDVTWVRILQFLPITERFRVSETCHALNNVLSHPSLWSHYDIILLGQNENYRRRADTCRFNDMQITQRFGKYFQNLTINVYGHLRDMTAYIKDTLSEIGKQCRLESLTIKAGIITSQFHTEYGYPPQNSAVTSLTSFVQHAFRMKHLHIQSWPMYENILASPSTNIFVAIVRNEALVRNLESLTLFGIDKKDWTERAPLLLSSVTTEIVVSAFNNLTHLGLRSPMITENLIETLALPDRAKLKVLDIVVHYIAGNEDFAVPEVSPKVWQSLVQRTGKGVRVNCTLPFDVPIWELSKLLKPEVPLSSLIFMKYSKLHKQTLISVSNHYKTSFTKLHILCDAYETDDELLQVANECKFMTELIYHGCVKSTTVTRLAQMKGPAWSFFEFKEASIKVASDYDDIDDDQVLSRGTDGELVIVGMMRFHQPEEHIRQCLDTMVVDVSRALDTPWKPC